MAVNDAYYLIQAVCRRQGDKMKKALIVFLSFLLIVNFSACGNKTDTKVHKSQNDYYNQWLYFTSFENYASVVGVCGSGVLTGKCDESSYTLNKLVKKLKMARDTVPDHTYYPVFDGKPAEIKMQEAKYELINFEVVGFEYGIMIDAIGNGSSDIWKASYKVTFDRTDKWAPKTADVEVKQVSLSCDEPEKALGWDRFAQSAKKITSKYYDNLLSDEEAENSCQIIMYTANGNVYCHLLIEGRIMVSICVSKTMNGYDHPTWDEFLEKYNTEWLERLSFERIDFEYDKYTEIVDRDETLESFRGKLNWYPEVVC